MAAGMGEQSLAEQCGCRLYKCKFCNPDKPRQSHQAASGADVALNNLLNDLNANEEMTITSENIPQDDAKEPRSELVIRGPERLLTALFNEVIRGRGI